MARPDADQPAPRPIGVRGVIRAAVLVPAFALAVACSGSDGGRDGDPGDTTDVLDVSTTSVDATSSTVAPALPSSSPVTPPDAPEAELATDRAILAGAAASGDFCTAYGAYDLMASRTEDPGSDDAVAIFRLGFEATAGITPLVPADVEDSWATFVFGAGLIDQAIGTTGRLPDDPELDASLDRLGYFEAGDEVTRWYLEHCG